MEIWKVEIENEATGTVLVYYKRTIQDVDGKDVVIPADIQRVTFSQLDQDEKNWNSQKVNCDYQIARIIEKRASIIEFLQNINKPELIPPELVPVEPPVIDPIVEG